MRSGCTRWSLKLERNKNQDVHGERTCEVTEHATVGESGDSKIRVNITVMQNKTRLIHKMLWNEGEDESFLNWISSQGDTCKFFLDKESLRGFSTSRIYEVKTPSAKRCPNAPAVRHKKVPKFTQSVYLSCRLGLIWLDVCVPSCLTYRDTWTSNY